MKNIKLYAAALFFVAMLAGTGAFALPNLTTVIDMPELELCLVPDIPTRSPADCGPDEVWDPTAPGISGGYWCNGVESFFQGSPGGCVKKPTDPCAASNKVTCGNSSLCCEKCNAPSVTYTPCGECGTRTETCSATKNSYGFYYLTTTACVDL